MKKKFLILLLVVSGITLNGCTNVQENKKEIKDLKISFVPSAPAEDILMATKPLEDLIKNQMQKLGYTIQKVSIDVGTSYEAVGEALSSGTTDIGFIPGGTYVLYAEDGVEPILTATRQKLNKNSEKAKDWNDHKPTISLDETITSYRSLIIAGPSDKGQELATKVNNGEKLTMNDIKNVNVCLQSPSSSSGYLYPAKLLKDSFSSQISDLSSTITTNGYGDALGRLAATQCDITPIYGDARMDYENDWISTYNREKSIWEETNVIGVTDPIMNDTISISTNSNIFNEQFVNDFQETMKNIATTPEGQEVIAIYSHNGYENAIVENYDTEKEIQQELIQG